MSSFAEQLARGRVAEEAAAEALARRGSLVVPTYLAGDVGCPPVAFYGGRRVVMPDLLSLSGDRCCWVEVKAKTAPSWRRNEKRWEHGIDHSLVKEYAEVQAFSGVPVWLLVVEDRGPVDPVRDSALTDFYARMMAVSLDAATACGRHEPLWPGGWLYPSRRGRRGEGGWLWPREAMTEIDLG